MAEAEEVKQPEQPENPKVFIRYNVGKKKSEDGEFDIPDNTLLFLANESDATNHGVIVTRLPDNTTQNLKTFKITNELVDDFFLVCNITKTKNLVVMPLNKDFNFDEFYSKYITQKIGDIPKRALVHMIEDKIRNEEYEVAATIRDEISKRETSSSEV